MGAEMGELRIESEPIRFTTLGRPAPDPKWRYTDARGHKHHREASEWPTLRWVVDRTYWCETCLDEHGEGHYECRKCGEHIEPGMVMEPPATKFIPGPKRYYLDGEEVTEDEAREFGAQWG
jgi:hypothetical protein